MGDADFHLREIRGAARHSPGRRWFSCAEMDLYLWESDGRFNSFELCYGKPHAEHSLRWNTDGGWVHTRVDDGESTPWRNDSPIVVSDGRYDPVDIALRFEALAANIDPRVYRFVLTRLYRA